MTPFRRILVPHDFSAAATRALRLAGDLAVAHGGRLLVLHVITPFHPVSALGADVPAWEPARDLVTDDRRRLEALVARVLVGRRRVRADCEVVIGDPFHRITDAARRVDSIVMATAGRTGLAHLLIGSVAEKVVRHATVPVLTVRPDARPRRRTAARRA